MSSGHWPFFELRIRTPRLELRPDWDEGLAALAEVAGAGIHDPATMPFFEPWSDLASGGPIERSVLQWSWRQRAELTPDKWRLCFIVSLDGEVVGTQGIEAEHFATCRVVETGSWLGRRFQGQGLGKEMRAAVLHLAFAGLGAVQARSGAFHDNAASLAVSRALGYQSNGERIKLRRDKPDRLLELVLTRAAWEKHRWTAPIEVDGLEACLPLLVET
ncbi:MAG TPA: GNAT family protein [Acidimicrobiales bacterium]|jgi:RimJ/RimL family protein N-acetyltransferase|nr:GNAT family protein [Acidimicrobiales bacterium]